MAKAVKDVLNKSKNQYEPATDVKCPRCSGFGSVLGDEGNCPICNGWGRCWKTESGWTLAKYASADKSTLY